MSFIVDMSDLNTTQQFSTIRKEIFLKISKPEFQVPNLVTM